MPQASVTSQVHQSFDVHGNVTPEITFHDELRDFLANLFYLRIAEALHLR